MEVRPPTAAELEAVVTVHVDAAEVGGAQVYDPETVAGWARRGDRSVDDYPVDDPASHFVVAVREEVLGFGEVVPEKREVRAVYVHPDHQRRGVGTALLSHLEGYARGCGVGQLQLKSSLNAVEFYRRHGYERTGSGESSGGVPVVDLRKRFRESPTDHRN